MHLESIRLIFSIQLITLLYSLGFMKKQTKNLCLSNKKKEENKTKRKALGSKGIPSLAFEFIQTTESLFVVLFFQNPELIMVFHEIREHTTS